MTLTENVGAFQGRTPLLYRERASRQRRIARWNKTRFSLALAVTLTIWLMADPIFEIVWRIWNDLRKPIAIHS
jgi:hypothetical protein